MHKKGNARVNRASKTNVHVKENRRERTANTAARSGRVICTVGDT